MLEVAEWLNHYFFVEQGLYTTYLRWAEIYDYHGVLLKTLDRPLGTSIFGQILCRAPNNFYDQVQIRLYQNSVSLEGPSLINFQYNLRYIYFWFILYVIFRIQVGQNKEKLFFWISEKVFWSWQKPVRKIIGVICSWVRSKTSVDFANIEISTKFKHRKTKKRTKLKLI